MIGNQRIKLIKRGTVFCLLAAATCLSACGPSGADFFDLGISESTTPLSKSDVSIANEFTYESQQVLMAFSVRSDEVDELLGQLKISTAGITIPYLDKIAEYCTTYKLSEGSERNAITKKWLETQKDSEQPCPFQLQLIQRVASTTEGKISDAIKTRNTSMVLTLDPKSKFAAETDFREFEASVSERTFTRKENIYRRGKQMESAHVTIRRTSRDLNDGGSFYLIGQYRHLKETQMIDDSHKIYSGRLRKAVSLEGERLKNVYFGQEGEYSPDGKLTLKSKLNNISKPDVVR